MYKLRNAVIALLLITARTEGVMAQSATVDNQKQETKIVKEVNPSVLMQAIKINPYDYSSQKLADKEMTSYSKEIAKEKEEENKKRSEEETRKRAQTNIQRQYTDTRSDFNELYQRAGAAFGISPYLLKAVHMVETGGSGSTSRSSYAGASGPMQFMPTTFRAYGVDGNSDGVIDITNVDDAVFTAAKYLSVNGGMGNVTNALWHYNHSYAYISKVLDIARSLGMQN